jgi:hypothetical protein
LQSCGKHLQILLKTNKITPAPLDLQSCGKHLQILLKTNKITYFQYITAPPRSAGFAILRKTFANPAENK